MAPWKPVWAEAFSRSINSKTLQNSNGRDVSADTLPWRQVLENLVSTYDDNFYQSPQGPAWDLFDWKILTQKGFQFFF